MVCARVCFVLCLCACFQKFGTCAAKCLTIEFYVQMLLFGSTLPMAKFNVHTLTRVYGYCKRKETTNIHCNKIEFGLLLLFDRAHSDEFSRPRWVQSTNPICFWWGGIVVNACLCYIVCIYLCIYCICTDTQQHKKGRLPSNSQPPHHHHHHTIIMRKRDSCACDGKPTPLDYQQQTAAAASAEASDTSWAHTIYLRVWFACSVAIASGGFCCSI